MKRKDLIRHLNEHGCQFVREGAKHSWWMNPKLKGKKFLKRKRHPAFLKTNQYGINVACEY
jgi:hypothetical protein